MERQVDFGGFNMSSGELMFNIIMTTKVTFSYKTWLEKGGLNGDHSGIQLQHASTDLQMKWPIPYLTYTIKRLHEKKSSEAIQNKYTVGGQKLTDTLSYGGECHVMHEFCSDVHCGNEEFADILGYLICVSLKPQPHEHP